MAQKPGPILPRADAPQVEFGGFAFTPGNPPASGGIFALTRRIGDFLFPVLIGEAEDMAAALTLLHAQEPVLTAGLAEGLYWMSREQARQRAHILRDLVGKYNPPLNKEHRKGRAAPEIAALAPDRAEGLPEDNPTEPVEVTEAELDALVRAFYAEAMQDPLIGPVFARNVTDWDHHFEIVRNFWSRALLGTTRYTGSPFTPHLQMNLKPEFFDRWIELFRSKANATLRPAAARVAIARVEHMSVCFQAGLFPPKSPAQEHAK
jgi:truncated hemoglobin YjbI